MKKILLLTVTAVLLISMASGCTKEAETVEFGWGEISQNTYTNEFFEFSIDLSPDMTFLSPQEILNANPPYDENGEEMEPIDISSIEDLASESVVQFVYGSLYNEEEPGRFNSYISGWAASLIPVYTAGL